MESSANYDAHCRMVFSSCYFLPLCFSIAFFRQSKHPSLPFVLRHLQSKPLYCPNSDRYSPSIFHFALYTRSASFVTPDRVVLPLTTAQWHLFLFEHKQYELLQQLVRCPACTRNWNEDLWEWNKELCVAIVRDIHHIRGNLGLSYLVTFHLFYVTKCCGPDHLYKSYFVIYCVVCLVTPP